jgi:hypothetical protein
MQLGDLAWDYSSAYAGQNFAPENKPMQMVIILEYPSPPESCRFAKVLTFDCEIKKVPVEFLLPIY